MNAQLCDSESSLPSELQRRVAEILDEYLSSVEQGHSIDTEQLIQRYPELAEPLREYLDGLALLREGALDFSPAPQTRHSSVLSDELQAGQLGDYQLIREVGRGGMGVVYEARQLSLDRKVALKVLPFAAVLDRRQIVRFENEARAAAQLHHPHIVPIHGVGSERGVHYYAMQFIEGRSLQQAIDELRQHAGIRDTGDREDSSQASGVFDDPTDEPSQRSGDREHPLSPSTCRAFSTERSHAGIEHTRAVARLGVQAAEALHAAHECSVIHRDVKPSNLLIDDQGKLWVTDFGLARCQTNASFTKPGDILGTLHYMSPEQAQGQSALVDQRTDVYSLGVTLYELLTLRRAFEGANCAAVLRQIESGEYLPAKAWNAAIPSDLQNVIDKAMATSRDERYLTARELADDLTRYLDGKPIHAKPPSLSQRATKWARRHRRGVIAAGIVFCMAFAGLVASTVLIANQKLETEAALETSLDNVRLAKANFEEAKSAVDVFGSRAAELLAEIPGTEHVRRELLAEVLGYHERFLRQAKTSPELRVDAALTYSEMGKINERIGAEEESLEAYRQSERLLLRLATDEPNKLAHQVRLARCQNSIGLLLRSLGRMQEARLALEQAIAIQSSAGGAEHPDVQVDLGLSWNNLGLLAADVGAPSDALDSYHHAIRVLNEVRQESPHNGDCLSALATVYNNLSLMQQETDPAKAKSRAEKSLSIRQQLVKAYPSEAIYRSDLAMAFNNLAALYSRTQEETSARGAYDQAIALLRGLMQEAPFVANYRRDLAVALNNRGRMQFQSGDLDQAESSFREALNLFGDYPTNAVNASRVGGVHNNLAMVFQQRGLLEHAAGQYAMGIRCQRYAYRRAPDISQFRDYLSRTYHNYGRILMHLKSPAKAAEMALQRRELWPGNAEQLGEVVRELAGAYRELPGDNVRQRARRERYANEAFATVQQAIEAGWLPTSGDRQLVLETFGSHTNLTTLLSPLSIETKRKESGTRLPHSKASEDTLQ